jgi:hypothetical protein
MPLLSIRAYGRHRNVSHVAVLKALRTGRIQQNADGLIDADEADRDWVRNTHPAPKAPGVVPAPLTEDFGFAKARTIREHFEARLAKLEYDERTEKLVNADEVKVATDQTTAEFRACMMSLPGRLAVQLAGTNDAQRVYELLSLEIRRALIEFADAPGGMQ